MKRRKVSPPRPALLSTCLLAGWLLVAFQMPPSSEAAIVPPPWSDPETNPCASLPGGWQLLYWPPLQKCFKIFSIGYPCPETMELSPTASVGKRKPAQNMTLAECRCPPGTALSGDTGKCHEIFSRGPCARGQYFGPQMEGMTASVRRRSLGNRMGLCKDPEPCPNEMLFWPKDGKCYTKFTRGPCVKGKLLVLNEDGLAECSCSDEGMLADYFYRSEESCHELYTKGPCSTPGHLFLPGGRCDCHSRLPHYHEEHQMCYELDTPGPCAPGNTFNLPDNLTAADEAVMPRAVCQCKEGYVPWTNGHCYRLYTRGPCGTNEFLVNATTCVRNFCGKNRLYFPEQNFCYRIGTQGPCSLYQVVVFDFTARPSVDGISYNGMCGCAGVIQNLDQQCSSDDRPPPPRQEPQQPLSTKHHPEVVNTCESTRGMVELNGRCYKLYTRGPCGPGQWLEPLKVRVPPPAQNGIASDYGSGKAKCVCRPGYTPAEGPLMGDLDGMVVQRCNAPIVSVGRYLNNYQRERLERPAVTALDSGLGGYS